MSVQYVILASITIYILGLIATLLLWGWFFRDEEEGLGMMMAGGWPILVPCSALMFLLALLFTSLIQLGSNLRGVRR